MEIDEGYRVVRVKVNFYIFVVVCDSRILVGFGEY